MHETEISLLMDLGFTNLEAMIYIALLKEPNITGYRVSKIIGKPVPNTYKALESLQNKGAIITDQSSRSKAYTPLPISEYLDQIEQGFKAKRKRVETVLETIGEPEINYGIFKLDSIEQVIARFQNLVASAESNIFLDIFPKPSPEIEPFLKKAVEDGKLVCIRCYEEYQLEGAEIFTLNDESKHAQVYPGRWCNVVVDSKQYLVSFFNKKGDQIAEAFWTNNPYIGLTAFNSSVHEYQVIRLFDMLIGDSSKKEMKSELVRLYNLFWANNKAKEFFESLFTTK